MYDTWFVLTAVVLFVLVLIGNVHGYPPWAWSGFMGSKWYNSWGPWAWRGWDDDWFDD
uniref:Uncharacterized shell protein 5 n=1 Tax=Margaritifera margaritifera TaxID=102329 RepID=USP5_PINMG|nr:RecName: Full=Uncharacterized shell protein 5; AltName: Full=Prism uncharacterized shell protein 20; Short=PUSP20; Flags: Precursor [Pinctada margaritifera]CCE46171.1 prism uncharacterized shell protein 20 [Pinctada margaritifera]